MFLIETIACIYTNALSSDLFDLQLMLIV